MAEFSKYEPGMFSWVDLMTTDNEAAKTFYTDLFGWKGVDVPTGDGGSYTMYYLGDKVVAGSGQMGSEQISQGMPPAWNSYVTVTNVDEAAAKVETLGGKLFAVMDVLEAGRMASFQDPTGAALAIWEPRNHIGSAIANLPGSFVWNELATTDAGAAKAFYTALFGWRTTEEPLPSGTYTTFSVGQRMNGGMLEMTEEWAGIPPHWMVYFAVEACDAAAAQVEKSGGKIHVPPTDMPQVGRFAVVSDPQGAIFTVMRVDNPD